MIRFTLVVLLMAAALCSITVTKPRVTSIQEAAKVHVPYISPELKPYVEQFMKDMTLNGIDVSRYNNLQAIIVVTNKTQICGDKDAVGCCDGITVKIKFAPYYIKDKETYYRLLTYHELGHCILRLEHLENHVSIMNPSPVAPLSFYKEYWGMLRHEMMEYYEYMKTKGLLLNFGNEQQLPK